MGQHSSEERTPTQIEGWVADHSLPLNLFFISRFGLFLLVYLSLILVPMANGPGQWRAHPENLFVDGWARWDSGWYNSIIERGYTNYPTAIGQDTAFFPVYPLLSRLVNLVIRDNHISAILVSNLAFLLALIVLFKLFRNRYGSDIGERTLTLISFGAFSFFFSAMYTESIFLLAVSCAFYYCERKKYVWAAFWGAVAGATRLLGATLLLPLIILYLEQRAYDWRKIKPNILWLSLSLMGIVAYGLFLTIRYGNPLQFVDSQGAWGTLNPMEAIINTISSWSWSGILTGAYPGMRTVHLLVFLGSALLALSYYKKVGLSYTLFSIIALVTSLTRAQGIGRYLIVVFPLYVAAAFFLRNKTLYDLVLFISVLLLALFAVMFSHWYWVA